DVFVLLFFFFSSRRRHTRWPRDWSSDVCSSDLRGRERRRARSRGGRAARPTGFRRRWRAARLRQAWRGGEPARPTRTSANRRGRSEERRVGKECRWGGWGGSWEKQRVRWCGSEG